MWSLLTIWGNSCNMHMMCFQLSKNYAPNSSTMHDCTCLISVALFMLYHVVLLQSHIREHSVCCTLGISPCCSCHGHWLFSSTNHPSPYLLQQEHACFATHLWCGRLHLEKNWHHFIFVSIYSRV